MKRLPKIRYSLRALMALTTCFAGALFFAFLPTLKAREFTELVLKQDADSAEAMLAPDIGEDDWHRLTVRYVCRYPNQVDLSTGEKTLRVEVLPTTLRQFFRAERTVLLGKHQGAYVEYVASPWTINPGEKYVR